MTRDEREVAEVEGYAIARGASRKQLCARLSIHESLLCKIFKGRHTPDLLFWVQLGEALRDMQDAISPPRFDRLASA